MRFLFLFFVSVVATVSLSQQGLGSVPDSQITDAMHERLRHLEAKQGWTNFLRIEKIASVTPETPGPSVIVMDWDLIFNNKVFSVAQGINSVYIEASPETVINVVNNPIYFEDLYGLDKPAVTPNEKISLSDYEARIYKLVPGIETQDYILHYKSRWDGEIWTQRAKLVRDQRQFGLRDNIKMVEKLGTGSIYREVSLFFPMRWWLRLLSGPLRSITSKELVKIGKSIKCTAERVQAGAPMDHTLARQCQKESSR